MDYTTEGNKVTISGKELLFDYPVKGTLEKDGVLMILLKVPAKFNYQRNIFGVSEEGEILWQVEAPTKDPVDLYTSLFEKDGDIKAYAWSGGDCYLDPKTGKILKKIFRPFG